jgi:hypothetical protein
VLADEILGWAQLAGYHWSPEKHSLTTGSGEFVTRISPREVTGSRLQLREDLGGADRLLLHAVNMNVVDRYLVTLLGDELREDLGLLFLHLPATAADFAPGYSLSQSANGFHTHPTPQRCPWPRCPQRSRPWPHLMPLPHFLGFNIDELKQAFLDVAGDPLLHRGRYRRRRP